ncbi:MAG: zinc-ribbon domain-containing protein [Alphaproteobacteria bacterium]|nr:zinc-ribbon domain-containing protein [Alphaproteobacteria bacterium]
MRVVCDQCAATYKVPNDKLSKPINKATCRQCGSRLLIPKPQPGADPDERVVVPAIPVTAGVGDAGLVVPGEEDDADKTVPVVRRQKKKVEDEGDDVALVTGAPMSGADRDLLARAGRGAPPPAPEPVVYRQEPAPAPVPPPPVYQAPAPPGPCARPARDGAGAAARGRARSRLRSPRPPSRPLPARPAMASGWRRSAPWRPCSAW